MTTQDEELIAKAESLTVDETREYPLDTLRVIQDLVDRLADALEARQVDEAALSNLILRSLVFTNDASKPWADSLARAVIEFLGERHEPEPCCAHPKCPGDSLCCCQS